ncbi:MAG TPA: biotin--[acetyl-CoA-carboxylase] ligase [Candidatus Methylacidiphilales bacterium]|jgi:BirA family biotin operon repressor/biotin-[acetyl-CoA-carboxylase] ligase|nr:biotin--[acetyl-CoA-carboxylase] ligase [Candidatus Methylacidiphilales bacterium]
MSSNRQQDGALLGALLSTRGHLVSRRELARAARLPTNELERRLAPYIEAGYPIEFHPQGSVGLREPPDIWCAEEIVGRCPARKNSPVPAWDPLLLAETSSTNEVAREQARKGARGGFVVAASRQTAGRGRLGRSWESPPDRGLYVSIVLRPDLPMTEAGKLTILGSVAAVDAVETVSGLRPQIKWPNDLMAGGRKLGGLLIETEPKGKRMAFAVMGIGVNVRQEAGDFSPEVRRLATSLYLATGQAYRRADVLVALLQGLERRLSRPFEEAREAWTASSLTLGQRVTLTTARGRKHGQALGLDESGALLLRRNSGEVETVTAGDMEAC